MLAFSFYLAHDQQHYYSMATMVASVFMWLLTIGAELNRNNKDK